MTILQLTDAPGGAVASPDGALPALPFEMAQLANGLTLIVREDRRHRLVSTQLRFDVGSKDEPAGRTGFAHLFEHLMFKESANRRGNWHRELHAMGGIGVNGTTDPDRTNYFQVVPTAALDRLLWMESDRMGHLLAGLDAAALAEEVAVVKNEKRQREGAPYGGVFEAVTTTLYPRDHPYGHTVLGSFEDLDNASLDTVADWHARWYGAANAVLVLVGDIGFAEAREKVEHWFGAIAPGMPKRRATQWLPEVRETKRIVLFDRVPMRRLFSIWSTPQAASPDSMQLQIIASILAGGAHSRLVQRLVDTERLCLGVGASQDGRALCGEFQIAATLAPGADAEAVEAAIDDEIRKFVAQGPSQQELDRARKRGRDGLYRMLDGLSAVTEMLASNMILHGRPDGHLPLIELAERASTEDIRAVAARWLDRKAVQLDVRPFEAVQAAIDPAMRTTAPAIGVVHASPFPDVEETRLANGLTIQVARGPGTYGVECALYIDGGAALDPEGREGLSQIALGAIDAGAGSYSKIELSQLLAEHGVQYRAEALRDGALLSASALKGDLDKALSLLARMLLDPAYPADEVQHLLDRQIAEVRGGGRAPGAAAEMALAPLVFGPTHALGRPIRGTVESLERIDRDLVIARHRAWQKPASATLIVVGDVTLDAVVAFAEAAFGGWAASESRSDAPPSLWQPRPGLYGIERPGAMQSALRLAIASPDIGFGNEALALLNTLFGGSFGSRINANLRERKGWTYGASSGLTLGASIGAFTIATDVQADRTLDALEEIENEIAALPGTRAPTEAEIDEARNALLVALPGRWASNAAIRDALVERRIYALPARYHQGIEQRIRGVTRDEVLAAAEIIGQPNRYTRVIAGDPAELDHAAMVRIDEQARAC